VDTSHHFALSVYANLVLAQSALHQLARSNSLDARGAASKNDLPPMFRSFGIVSSDGRMLGKTDAFDGSAYDISSLLHLPHATDQPRRGTLLFHPSENGFSSIAMALPRVDNTYPGSLLIAEIDPAFLWRERENLPPHLNLCVTKGGSVTLFCTSPAAFAEKNIATTAENVGAWDLFLRAEFRDDSWRFITRRNTSGKYEERLVFNGGYITIALISLVLVALLSLILIRRTLVPLERLTEGARRIAEGDFSMIQISADDEFGELASAVNDMSAHIDRQFDTLQVLAAIDHEIMFRLDVARVIERVITRIQRLMPVTTVCVVRLAGTAGSEARCYLKQSSDISVHRLPLPVTPEEIDEIRSYAGGKNTRCRINGAPVHQRLFAEAGLTECWVLPIFWQDEIRAFLMIGDSAPLVLDQLGWNEIHELANRVGVAVAADEHEEQLVHQARYDSLTGLPNRILLQEKLREAMERSDRSERPIWVVFLDLDRFKFVNDSLGHQAGDTLLKEISNRLSGVVRKTDTVARFGGDEFILILQELSDEPIGIGFLQRLIDTVSIPVVIDGQEFFITCSIGVATYPADGTTLETLVTHADVAMYRAKELGKNNFQFYTEAMNENAAERLRIESNLRNALERGEFLLHYQPQVDLHSGRMVGVEALLRWNHPELGMIAPVRFIGVAEETGLIVPIGAWVLRTACAQNVAWQRAGIENLRVAVNLSARQFAEQDLGPSIAAILEETGLTPAYLELELTESLIMTDIDRNIAMLHELRALGVHLSIDDFGTGYSSLSYLKDFPISTLKIDRSFIHDIALEDDNAAIVTSIITLAHSLRLKVIAEGVETIEQLNYLIARGCDEIQGFYFGRPEPADVIERMIKEDKNMR
jgi:diguanylate cyclase (GGDEF)-like protein